MTDLDFEELDKAVSDLMKDTDEPQSEAAIPVAAQPAPAAPYGASPAATPDPAPEAPNNSGETPLAVKRRGKFMDMVRTPAGGPVQMPVSAPKREGITVTAPSDEPAQPADMSQAEDTTEPATAPETPAVSAAGYANNPAPASEWPDPIDMMESLAAKADAPEATEPTEETTPATPAVEPAEEATSERPVEPEPSEPNLEQSFESKLSTVLQPEVSDEPTASDLPIVEDAPTEEAMTSPFLPDAKVDKRPLGEFTADPQPHTDDAPEAEPQNEDEPESAEPVGAPAPPVAESEVEATSTEESIDDSTSPQGDAAEQAPAMPQATDIPQQYTEQAPSAPAENGAIYDTAAYHTPLAAVPAKKHGAAMAIIWILVILIIGACAGAAYFYFTTPR